MDSVVCAEGLCDEVLLLWLLLYMLIGSECVVSNINSHLPQQIRVLGMYCM